MYKTAYLLYKTDFLEKNMKIEDIRPKIRFADSLEYTHARPLSKTYDSRLLYFTDGEGSITVDGRTEKIQRGLLVIFQGATPYKLDPKKGFTAFAVDFDLDGEYECDGFILPTPASLFDKDKLHKRVSFENSDFLSCPFVETVRASVGDGIRAIAEEYNSGRAFSKARAELMLGAALLGVAESFSPRSKRSRCAESATDYINDHYREELTNASVAAALGHEPCYLNRTVKLHTGYTVHRLINKKRIDEAIKLLLSTDLSLEEIAERVGFCNASHLSRRCKELSGKTPSFYRQK